MISAMNKKQLDILEWNESTFLGSTADGKARHCMKECNELKEALENSIIYKLDGWEQEALAEFADIFILMSAWAGMQGYSLEEAIDEKMAINRGRKWGQMDSQGVVEHLKEAK